MEWRTLLCAQRTRQTVSRASGNRDLRSEFEKDYHRIIGSASFRRLQDKTQVFPLDKSDFEHIAAIMLGDTKKALSERGIDLMWTPAVEKYIAEKSFSEKYGARNMRRFISREIEDAAAEKIISEYDRHISLITIDSDGEKLDIETR